MDSARARAYAELIVGVGANVQPGQHVFVQTAVEHAPFAREVAASAYDAGAGYVDVLYMDQFVRRLLIENAEEDILSYSPPWLLQRIESMNELRAAEIFLTGDPTPNAFAGLNEARVGRAHPREYARRLMQFRATNIVWTVAAVPSLGWSELVFGTPDLERLWDAVEQAVRLDEPDPLASWDEHLARLRERADLLNSRRFDALHFEGPGTDLVIGLLDVSRWITADEERSDGRRFCANLPTEEVFTAPDPQRTEGVVSATRPFRPNPNAVVEGLTLRFEQGRIVDVKAARGADVVRGHLDLDPHAAFLGEVALVDGGSRVGQLNTTFYSTLIDENATSHIAYGAAIPRTTGFQPGGNQAPVHADLMIGGPNVTVSGIDREGNRVVILRDDIWVLDHAA